jgi:UTP--glucose-1-phosphate uridylyltransferase
MKKVRKAVIPAAGLGTRVFPATKAVPKGMFPIVDKPSVQYIVEEAVQSGIENILIIINPLDTVTEKHFSRLPELEKKLAGKDSRLNTVISLSQIANISFLIQEEQKGLGHAVLLARDFAAEDAFAVMYADDVITGGDPCIGQLCRVYEKQGKAVVGINRVGNDIIHKYASLKVETLGSNVYNVTDMIEKPEKGREFSDFSTLGRCVLTCDIFDILENTPPGAGDEIQLTDALKILARKGEMLGVEIEGTHYDIGDKLEILKANVELGMFHSEVGLKFRKWLADINLSILR